MTFHKTWRAAQEQASSALKRFREADGSSDAEKRMQVAQWAISEALALDNRVLDEKWRKHRKFGE